MNLLFFISLNYIHISIILFITLIVISLVYIAFNYDFIANLMLMISSIMILIIPIGLISNLYFKHIDLKNSIICIDD